MLPSSKTMSGERKERNGVGGVSEKLSRGAGAGVGGAGAGVAGAGSIRDAGGNIDAEGTAGADGKLMQIQVLMLKVFE